MLYNSFSELKPSLAVLLMPLKVVLTYSLRLVSKSSNAREVEFFMYSKNTEFSTEESSICYICSDLR